MKIRKTIEVEVNTNDAKVARRVFSDCILGAYVNNKDMVEGIAIIEDGGEDGGNE